LEEEAEQLVRWLQHLVVVELVVVEILHRLLVFHQLVVVEAEVVQMV
tara:strand:- start:550 stop:690 length:141 start_codon:yes stop_codon:yes gene_type:complete